MPIPCRFHLVPAVLAVAALLCPGASPAAEVDHGAVETMIALNKRAFTDIQAKKFESARNALLEAIVVGKEAGLQADEMMARTHVHLAAVFLTGAKSRDKAINQFMLALRINPNITMTSALDTPALKSAYLFARKRLGLPPEPDPDAPEGGASAAIPLPEPEPIPLPRPGQPPPGGTAVVEPDLPAKVGAPLICPLAFEIPPKQELTIRCLTQVARTKSTATVFYRTEGSVSEDFTEVAMTRSPKGWLTAIIPANAVVGKALAYYIEARLPDSPDPLYFGSQEAPNYFNIRSDTVGEPIAQDDDPLKAITLTNAEAEDLRLYHRRLPGALFLGLSAGTGAGYHGREYVDSGARNASDLANGLPFDQARGVLAPAGFAPARLLHVEVELGYQLSKRLALSAFGRYQYAPKDGRGGQAASENAVLTRAIAGFVRAQYTLATWGNLQAYASGGLGGGRNFLLTFPKTCEEAKPGVPCVLAHSDTLSSHGFAGLASAGLLYHFSRWFGVFVEFKEIATLPKFLALSEANLGVVFAYHLVGEDP